MAKIATTIEQAYNLFNLPPLETEIWKPVVGYEGYYEISSIGRCKSLKRRIYKNESKRSFSQVYPGLMLNMRISDRGYIKYKLTKDNKEKLIPAHRLIAMAFLENPFNLPEVNHIDGNKLNNRVENLEWCTHKQNMNHGAKMGLFKKKRILGCGTIL